MFITGVDPTEVSTTPKYPLGSLALVVEPVGHTHQIYLYCQADGTGLTAGFVAAIGGGSASVGYSAAMLNTTNSAPGTGIGKAVGISPTGIPASNYGWVMVYGSTPARVLASAGAYTQLNTTATTGALDDDATAGSEVIDGIVLRTANGGAAANTNALLTWPRVGRTL
jgi:hypothetical protein